MRLTLLLTVPPDCQGESNIGEKETRNRRVSFTGNGNAIRLHPLPHT